MFDVHYPVLSRFPAMISLPPDQIQVLDRMVAALFKSANRRVLRNVHSNGKLVECLLHEIRARGYFNDEDLATIETFFQRYPQVISYLAEAALSGYVVLSYFPAKISLDEDRAALLDKSLASLLQNANRDVLRTELQEGRLDQSVFLELLFDGQFTTAELTTIRAFFEAYPDALQSVAQATLLDSVPVA